MGPIVILESMIYNLPSRLLCLTVFIFSSSLLWAEFNEKEYLKDGLLGAELAFSDETSQKSESPDDPSEDYTPTKEAQAALASHIEYLKKECPDCILQTRSGKFKQTEYKLVFRSDFWFNLGHDPRIYEVQSRPASLLELKLNQNKFDRLYQKGKEHKMHASNQGGGHIHFGIDQSFGKDAELFRNFVVDFYNHSELSRGVLSYDKKNSPHLMDHDSEDHYLEHFSKVINEFDSGKHQSVQKLARQIEDKVYISNHFKTTESANNHYQALGLKTIRKRSSSDRTLEIRSIRSQKNSKQFFLAAKLFISRIEYLYLLNTKIPVHIQKPVNNRDAFYRYVVEMGLNWEEFSQLAPEKPSSKPLMKDLIPHLHRFNWNNKRHRIYFENLLQHKNDWQIHIAFNLLSQSQSLKSEYAISSLVSLIDQIQLDSEWPRFLPRILYASPLWNNSIKGLEIFRKLIHTKNEVVNFQLSKLLFDLEFLDTLSTQELFAVLKNLFSLAINIDYAKMYTLRSDKLSNAQKSELIGLLIERIEENPILLQTSQKRWELRTDKELRKVLFKNHSAKNLWKLQIRPKFCVQQLLLF